MANPHPKMPPVEHRFKKGHVANPGGRPPGGITEYLRKIGEEIAGTYDGKKTTYREALSRVLVNKALKGDMRAMQIVIERLDGKVPDDVRLQGANGGNVNIFTGNEVFDAFREFMRRRLEYATDVGQRPSTDVAQYPQAGA